MSCRFDQHQVMHVMRECDYGPDFMQKDCLQCEATALSTKDMSSVARNRLYAVQCARVYRHDKLCVACSQLRQTPWSILKLIYECQ